MRATNALQDGWPHSRVSAPKVAPRRSPAKVDWPLHRVALLANPIQMRVGGGAAGRRGGASSGGQAGRRVGDTVARRDDGSRGKYVTMWIWSMGACVGVSGWSGEYHRQRVRQEATSIIAAAYQLDLIIPRL